MPYDRFGDFGPYHHGGHPLLWAIFAILLTLLLLALIGSLLGSRRPGWRQASPAPGAAQDPSLSTLRLRYARGEIDRKQFLQMSRDLGEPQTGAEAPPAVPPP